MKLYRIIGWSSALCLSALTLPAQETNETDALKKQLKQATDNFEKALQENRKIIDALSNRLETLERQKAVPVTSPATTAQTPPSSAPPSAVSGGSEAGAKWSPASPMRLIGAGQNYINLSFDGLAVVGTSTAKDIEQLQPGGHDPKQRGFTIQNLETTFDGKVDPYFRGQANIVLQIDPAGETSIEAEEAYLETMSLPLNLQVKAGQFFTEFGRLNPTHPHTWDFVDQPLVNARLFGEDGLRNPGARVSYLLPTPFYSELFFTVQNSQGETAHSFRNEHEKESFLGRTHDLGRVDNLGDMLFVPRAVASFNLSDSQTIVAGASAAFGPNGSGLHENTQIYGVDLFYKWKPVNQHAGFPFVSWQTEAMVRRFGAAESTSADLDGDTNPDFVPRETLLDYGFYSQVAYGFRKGWIAALRGDYVTSPTADYEKAYAFRDLDRATRWRISPDVTYYPTEFSKIRLQYNFDRRTGIGDDHSVWLQFEFLLGSHAAHKF